MIRRRSKKLKMDRVTVIQQIIDRKKAKTYLEIGIYKGDCLLHLKARKKIGVDIKSLIPFSKKRKRLLKNLTNLFNEYYFMASDEFFEKAEKILNGREPEVIFVDGLHTFEQTVKDVENSLRFLKENGVIVLHDCNPPSESAAYPATSFEEAMSLNLPGWTGDWCGNVWKTIPYLRSTRKDLRIFTLDCDWGLGIVTRGRTTEPLEFSLEEIENFTYKDLEKDRKNLLNLKAPEYLQEFIKELL